MRIDETVQLPSDSSARITAASLLGGNFLELLPGAGEDVMPEGTIILIRVIRSACLICWAKLCFRVMAELSKYFGPIRSLAVLNIKPFTGVWSGAKLAEFRTSLPADYG